jgi:hypothetical protein
VQHLCIGDMKLGLLGRAHIRGMRLIHEESQFPEHRAGRRDFSELYAILTTSTAPLLRISNRPVAVPADNSVSPASHFLTGRLSSLC